MKKFNAARQLKAFDLALFILSLTGFEYFGMKTASGFINLPVSLTTAGEGWLALWVLLAALEILLASVLGGGDKKLFSTAFVLTHAPWMLGFALPLLVYALVFPEKL